MGGPQTRKPNANDMVIRRAVPTPTPKTTDIADNIYLFGYGRPVTAQWETSQCVT